MCFNELITPYCFTYFVDGDVWYISTDTGEDVVVILQLPRNKFHGILLHTNIKRYRVIFIVFI